ncbi:hypothetical protein JMJ35_004391 [Cladonia borealis]|uniref:C3H1-type domain-containing protein n=1 Tax=Cladonia borealis TaxID=184061 RepID=A0AA39V8R1_9LECA|nr:hypothetical protein JMJ35_004391 [Cladonia borealis]
MSTPFTDATTNGEVQSFWTVGCAVADSYNISSLTTNPLKLESVRTIQLYTQMAYTNHSDRKLQADASLNNPYTNEKYRGFSGESESLVSWNTDRARTYSDIKSSPAADHRTPTLAISPASLGSEYHTSPRSVKHITCHYWRYGPKGCSKTSEECKYAHELRAIIADAPIHVEPGKPAVAGRNASNWQLEHSRPAMQNHGSEVQQQVDHIKAKTTQNNPHTEFEAYTPNRKTMHPPQSDSAPDSVNNPHNLDMLGIHPKMSRQSAGLSPSIGYFASGENGAFNQPFGKDATNYNPTTHYGAAVPAHHPTQQTSPGRYPQPIDHIMFENLKHEQTKMMRYKDQAIYRFASEIDLAIETMEESQKSNERDIQKLIDVTEGKVEKANLVWTQGDDESPYRGGGKFFNSNGAYQLNTHVPALAPKRKITGTYMSCYETNHDLPYELTTIAEKLAQTHNTTQHFITRLRNAKQMLGIAFENVGEQAVLPKGWIQH